MKKQQLLLSILTLFICQAMSIPCFSHKKMASKRYVAPTDSTQIMSYKEARKYVSEEQRYDIHGQFKKIHLNWDEYRRKPHTLADLERMIKEARRKPHISQRDMLKARKGHESRELHRVVGSGEHRQLEGATDSVRIDVRRVYYINNEEAVAIDFCFKIQESEERYMVVDERVEKSVICYWASDGTMHQKPIKLNNPIIELLEYQPRKYNFSTTFKYRGKWYYFYATENGFVTRCIPVK